MALILLLVALWLACGVVHYGLFLGSFHLKGLMRFPDLAAGNRLFAAAFIPGGLISLISTVLCIGLGWDSPPGVPRFSGGLKWR